MVRGLYIAFCFVVLLVFSGAATGQPYNPFKTPTDDFSKAFLSIYKEVPLYFSDIKGKEIQIAHIVNYSCRKYITGCKSCFISSETYSDCVFDFGSFETIEEAQSAMVRLSTKVSTALSQKVIIRYVDSTNELAVLKRTAIAEIKDDGFYGYNIMVDVIKKTPMTGDYGLRLTLVGGEGIFYRIIHRGEPLRSPFFKQSFTRIQTQFAEALSYRCLEPLPGFSCMPADSTGKSMLAMVKNIADFADARTEMECLTTSLRAMLGESFLYYFMPAANEVLKKVVFVRYVDHDLYDRRSISASLEKNNENGYLVKVTMYHP